MRTTRRARASALLALCTAGVLAGTTLSIDGFATAAQRPLPRGFQLSAEAPVFDVVSEGLDPETAKALAGRAGISADALRKDGSFSFVDPKGVATVPTVRAKRPGKDEDGRRVVARSLDLDALRALQVLPEEKALGRARELLPTPEGFEVSPRVTHTQATVSLKRGTETFDLDTAVSYDLSLNQVPVVGPGAKSRIAFGGDGQVTALQASVRSVRPAGSVGIIGADSAQGACQALYPRADLGRPRLVYYAPPLVAGAKQVQQLLPAYSCQPAGESQDAVSEVGGRLVPAAPDLTPQVQLAARRSGKRVKAHVQVDGGTAPYAVRWSSATRVLKKKAGDELGYRVGGRGRAAAEHLTATVTDANGIVSVASVALGKKGSAEASGYGGGGGVFGEVGIENMVDEWQCAQDSAQGFHNVMASRSQTVKFDWRGANAWESDFHDSSSGGDDRHWVDDVDAQWYTGHGNSGGFTFKSNHNDGSITPSDAQWGEDWNLEWLQLESCQVLRDTNGAHDYFARWAPAFDGLHMLNGFDTNAYCINGGTGARFASYLFPTWWRGALTVQQAWAQMAYDLEPSGVKWRSISPIGPGGVTNINDRYWGQGATGPDIRAKDRIGFISISGTV